GAPAAGPVAGAAGRGVVSMGGSSLPSAPRGPSRRGGRRAARPPGHPAGAAGATRPVRSPTAGGHHALTNYSRPARRERDGAAKRRHHHGRGQPAIARREPPPPCSTSASDQRDGPEEQTIPSPERWPAVPVEVPRSRVYGNPPTTTATLCGPRRHPCRGD